MLLLLELVFLVDATYLNAELSAADLLVSPLRVALLAAPLVYFLSFWSERWRPFFLSGIASLLLAGAGHSISSIMANVARAANLLVPKTAVEACVVSIVGAFVFLLLGAAVSLSNNSRPRRDNQRGTVPTRGPE